VVGQVGHDEIWEGDSAMPSIGLGRTEDLAAAAYLGECSLDPDRRVAKSMSMMAFSSRYALAVVAAYATIKQILPPATYVPLFDLGHSPAAQSWNEMIC
jgi:hypothetical protein